MGQPRTPPHFYYFGSNSIDIPNGFDHLEKKGPGFRRDFDSAYLRRFVEWLEKYKLGPGKHGEPCYQELLRVGIDTGSGGIHGPLFSDGSFE